MWGTSRQSPDALEFYTKWSVLQQNVRNVEVVWNKVHRNTLARLLLEQLQVRKVEVDAKLVPT